MASHMNVKFRSQCLHIEALNIIYHYCRNFFALIEGLTRVNNKIIIILFFILQLALLNAGCGPQDFGMEYDIQGAQGQYFPQYAENSPDLNTASAIKLAEHNHVQPTKVIHTQETQRETVFMDHYLERHIWRPGEGYPPMYSDKYFIKTHQGIAK